jgi:hypothetical protein
MFAFSERLFTHTLAWMTNDGERIQQSTVYLARSALEAADALRSSRRSTASTWGDVPNAQRANRT